MNGFRIRVTIMVKLIVNSTYPWLIAVMVYKIFNNLTPSYLPEYFKMTSDIHQRSLRSTVENLSYIQKPNTELFRKSLSYSGSKIWHAIPDHIKQSTSIAHFKRDYLKWTFHNTVEVLCMYIAFCIVLYL